jgi:amidase
MNDDLGAFRLRVNISDEAGKDGPLAGLTFAVKDMYDVQGLTTGGGNPDWLASHAPAEETASPVSASLRAGARLIGIAMADEMAFSPFGENHHYGTPVNPAAPGRVPGGSSSGSASATAGGLVDFALGGDTAGSVRIPASYCGLFGLRTTIGRVSCDGVMPLSPSFDVVGWFAREAALLERVGSVLLDDDEAEVQAPPRRLLFLEDAFELADAAARPALEDAASQVSEALSAPLERIRLSDQGYADWVRHFNSLRPPEIWAIYGNWITESKPQFGPRTAKRFAAVEAAAGADTTAAKAFRAAIQEKAVTLLGDDGFFVLPSMPGIAPKLGLSVEDSADLRENIFRISGIAPMLGAPEVSLPLVELEGCPIGLSLLGPKNSDRRLLSAATRVATAGKR